jgi:hypothetical protein
MHPSFRRSQESGSYLYRARSQYQRRCNSTCIRDPTRSYDWHGNRINNLRQKGHQAYHLLFRFVCMKGSSVSPSLHALRHDNAAPASSAACASAAVVTFANHKILRAFSSDTKAGA